MKRGLKLVFLLLFIICMTGCSDKNSKTPSSNNSNVDKVMQEQVDKADSGLAKETQNAAESNASDDNRIIEDQTIMTKNSVNEEENRQDIEASEDEIDYDFTTMGSDMVYATVYQMMINPNEYVGKTVKMSGSYYANYFEPTDKYYHYVIIQDATACCEQGLEFVWDDGSHVYPDEYPKEETEVEVIGVFETYTEEGDDYLYCRLKDASFQIADFESTEK